MNFEEDEQKNKRLSQILSSVDKNSVRPDKAFLERLQEKSTAEFTASSANNKKYSKTTFPIWRIIMKSNITKFAAAAVIIIIITLVLNQFGTFIDGTSKAFAQVLENTNKMLWIRIDNTYLRFDDPNKPSSGQSIIWFNVSDKIYASRYSTGGLYRDYTNRIRYEYESENNTLHINRMAEPTDRSSWFDDLETNSDFLITQYLSLDPNYGNIEKSTGQYQGKDVDFYTINTINKDSNATKEIFVDRQTNLIICNFSKLTDFSGKLLIDGIATFSYPDEGPKDIYELVGDIPETVKIFDSTK